jgi:hypothetical protein
MSDQRSSHDPHATTTVPSSNSGVKINDVADGGSGGGGKKKRRQSDVHTWRHSLAWLPGMGGSSKRD